MNQNQIHIASCRKLKAVNKQKATEFAISIEDMDLLQIDYSNNIQFANQTFDAVVFTSQHAVKAFVEFNTKRKNTMVNLPTHCFCIEGETSRLANENGFRIIETAPNSKLLAQEILKRNIKSILFFCGNEHLEDWMIDLNAKNILVEKCVVYYKNTVSHQFKNIDGAMFFSPSQVDAFLIRNELKIVIPVFSIGETTAAFLHQKGFQNIIISKQKTEESVIDSVINYFSK